MKIILDLHGARATEGVDIDAFEVFLENFRRALREFDRARRGTISRRGGHPDARDAAASAFRLVAFETGSGIATLEPTRFQDPDAGDLPLDDGGDDLSVTTLRALMDAVNDEEEQLPDAVVEALGSARRAIGDDGSFGVKVGIGPARVHVVIDETAMARLQRQPNEEDDRTVTVTGRLHMIEVDLPSRRVAIRAQDGIDWTCSYADEMQAAVKQVIDKLVRVQGTGRRITAATGRLRIEALQPIPEHQQGALFTSDPVAVELLRAEQEIHRPQGLGALVDQEWEDDEEGRRFLEATLGTSLP